MDPEQVCHVLLTLERLLQNTRGPSRPGTRPRVRCTNAQEV